MFIANSNLVPQWATWEEFRRLEQLGLTMYGQMTAGSWIYIGTRASCRHLRDVRRDRGQTLWRILAGTITLPPGWAAWAARSRWPSR